MGLQETSIIFQNIRHRHYYLCDYLPLTSGIDPVSRSLLKFKRGVQPDLDNWLSKTRCALHTKPLTLPPDTIIIRALHHKETRAAQDRPSTLDLLGQTLSGHFHFPYHPQLLHKTRPTNTVQGLTRRQRQAELQDVYQVNLPVTINITTNLPAAAPPTSLLLIDDILTTGTTIRMIIKTLHSTLPNSTITIFTLAKVATAHPHPIPDWLLI
ncbi:ComF family protein [Puia dinghuensis]|uniref:Phosphoribosyltransferase domain-containing protein n=1 Tax=Puia dinghuensis TaxID=1792502 RepID=A0A8J2UGK5_9BACT|nr:ComF family protein [Puia dinghuensis]GGB14886.1 hypothetical protein GCM10011511_43300 [Puia dinghuensis]